MKSDPGWQPPQEPGGDRVAITPPQKKQTSRCTPPTGSAGELAGGLLGDDSSLANTSGATGDVSRSGSGVTSHGWAGLSLK
eukprot:5973165-Pyramimonas_sp.AAC.1